MSDISTSNVQQQLIDNFAFLGEWMERYKYIIDLGNKLPAFPDEWRCDNNKVKGCLSQVWMHAAFDGNKIHFAAISDSAIVSGLIAILMMIYNDRSPEEILATEPTFIQQLGLDQHLSPTRSNGLHAMLKHIKIKAKQYQLEQQYEQCP